MFFFISKIFWTIASPLNFIWILVTLGLVYAVVVKQKLNKTLLLGLSLFLVLGVVPIGYNLTVFLETRYDRPLVMPAKVDGIIVLGGGFNAETSHITGRMAVNGGVSRAIDFVELAQKYPKARLVYSGGSGRLFHQDKGESPIAAKFFKLSSLDEGRVIYEEASRNTSENAINSKEIVKPKKGEVWILVTSMFHMSRSMGVFYKQEWDVIPYPVGPMTDGKYRILPPSFDVMNSFKLLEKSVRELVGSTIYYFSRKSAFILPLSPLESRESLD